MSAADDGAAVSIIVSGGSAPEVLSRCLTGVVSSSRQCDEVVVVLRSDNESVHTEVQRFSAGEMPVRAISFTEPSVWSALMAGLADARHDIVAFLDDAAVPMPNWSAELSAAFMDPAVGAVGGQVLSFFSAVRTDNGFVGPGPIAHVDWLGRPTSHLQGWRMARVVEDAAFLPTSNMAFRKQLLDGLHPLNVPGAVPNVGMQLLLAEAVRSRGFRVVFDSNIRVEHHSGTDDPNDAVFVHAFEYAYAMTLALSVRSLVARVANSLLGSAVAPGVLMRSKSKRSGPEEARRWQAARLGRRSATGDRRRLRSAYP